MPTVADYTIVLGGTKDGPAVSDELNFTLPSNVVPGHRSILTFTFYAAGSPIHIDIKVNGHGVGWYEFENVFSTFSRPVKNNVLKPGANVIRFIATNLGDDYAVIALYHVTLIWHKQI